MLKIGLMRIEIYNDVHFYCHHRWLGHVERMDEYRMVRRMFMAEVSGGRVRTRPRLGWMDGVKVALGNRGMTVKAARQCGKDRKEWRALLHV